MQRLLLSILLLAGSAGVASAQRGIDDQVFKPAIDSYGIFGTERARTSHQYDFGFLFYFDYAANPLHLKLQASDGRFPDTKVVDSAATFHLGAHMGLTDHIELAFDMPMTRQSLNAQGFGVAVNPTTGGPTGFFQVDPGTNVTPSDVAPGDMRWALKVNAWQGGPLSLGAAVIATLPFGDETEFLGASSFTVQPLAIADFTLGRLGIAINAGYRWHNSKDVVLDPTTVANNRRAAQTGTGMMSPPPVLIAESDEITASGAGIVHFNPYVSGAVQVMHIEPINAPDYLKGMPGAINGDPVTDVLAGVHIHPLADFTVSLGGGLGVQTSARQEDFTVVAGLAWAPEGEGTGGIMMGGDRDHDGVPDAQDLCPDEPEDRDGFEDADGCPDPDNDQDGIPDAQDRCPNEPEDRDGFQDADGCPDPDNDGDGIPDIQDKCPNEPEDRDGFQDEDGCPDPDNDGDGIPDAQDKCPNEPETFNGIDDEDGCPDFAVGGKGTFTIPEKILFKERSAKLEPAMTKLLDEIAARLKRNPQVKRVRVEGHTDNAGNAAFQQHISQQRADTVREYLIRKGVPTTLESAGYGAKRPIETNSTKDGRAKNRRVELQPLD